MTQKGRKKGVFITFEGPEGGGKTTQIHRLAEALRKHGEDVLVTREPGGCPTADKIRAILLDPESAGMEPATEVMLFNAARREHVRQVIRPALTRGYIVLCDRFFDSTVAYQAYGRGQDLAFITDMNLIGSAALTPDLTLLFDLNPEIGLGRARVRNVQTGNKEERFDAEDIAFHHRVRDGYLTLWKQDRERIKLINANQTESDVFRDLWNVVGRSLFGEVS